MRVIYFLLKTFSSNLQRGKKKKTEDSKKRAKEGWNKRGKERKMGETKNRKLDAKDGKNRGAN